MLKINFVKDRIKPIRSTAEKLHPLLMGLMLVGYGVILGLGIVGYGKISHSRATAQGMLKKLQKQTKKKQKPAAEYTKKDKKMVQHARRLRMILSERVNYMAILKSMSDSLPEQASLESVSVKAGARLQITGIVAAPTDARSKVWGFIRQLEKRKQFMEQVSDINLQRAKTIESPPGLRFVIVAPLSGGSLQSIIRSAH